MKVLIECQYFPPIRYFSLIKESSEVWIESKENFIKQTYRNRCYILGSNKILPLTVPLVGGNKKVSIDEIKIDYCEKWLNNHWKAITSAYNRSPFFEYYEPFIHDILFRKHDTLFALNREILALCLKILNISTLIKYTSVYENIPFGEIKDIRSLIHPKKEYLCKRAFIPIPYHQLFGSKFATNLSVLDLISCVGSNSGNYL